MDIKKFNEVSEPTVEVEDLYGEKYVKATITLTIKAYIGTDNISEVTLSEAKSAVMEHLYSLAGSNDGSELLANVRSNQITFPRMK